MNLYAVTADRLVAGAGEEAGRRVRGGGHQKTVDFVCVTREHGLTIPVLG